VILKTAQTYNFLLAEDADGGCLLGLDGGTVGVDGNASTSGLGLLVLAVDTVLLGDRHLDCMSCVVWWKTDEAETKSEGLDSDKRLLIFAWRDPVFPSYQSYLI
jgi:hypothetical protein